jgi:hypothetical protein
MDRVLEVLEKYNVTPLQLATLIAYSLEYHLEDIRENSYPDLYPQEGEKLMEELNQLTWRL